MSCDKINGVVVYVEIKKIKSSSAESRPREMKEKENIVDSQLKLKRPEKSCGQLQSNGVPTA